MRFGGGEFSTGTTGNIQPELTQQFLDESFQHDWWALYGKCNWLCQKP